MIHRSKLVGYGTSILPSWLNEVASQCYNGNDSFTKGSFGRGYAHSPRGGQNQQCREVTRDGEIRASLAMIYMQDAAMLCKSLVCGGDG